tara:strand:- start:1022 stop:1216 length:195 start_codon:yes stop_codon:yes gene_type:complete
MHNEEHQRDTMETLDKVIVDIPSRKFVLFSNTGDRKEVDCDMDQFMRVLSLIRELVPTEEVIYV